MGKQVIRKHIFTVMASALFMTAGAAQAETIKIETTYSHQSPSFAFGDYIFESVSGAGIQINVGNEHRDYEDFIVSNACCAGDITLRRVDDAAFTLQGIRYGGNFDTIIGGHTVEGFGGVSYLNGDEWTDHTFAGNASLTNVDSILFSPLGFFQLSSFDVTTSAVPIPAAIWLFGSALAGLGWFRRKQTV
jgi:hypothetical protein